MRKILVGVISFCLFSPSVVADEKSEVMNIITRVNNTWQQSHGAPEYGGTKAGLSAFWDNAVYHTGNMEAYSLMKTQAWYDYSFAWAEKNAWFGATEKDNSKWKYKNYGEDPQHVLFGDWQICFQTYIDLYNYSSAPQESWIARAKEVMSYEAYSSADDYWWWADALYMVMPVMTKMYLLTGDEAYLDKMYATKIQAYISVMVNMYILSIPLVLPKKIFGHVVMDG